MEEIRYRAVIKYLILKKETNGEIKTKLTEIYDYSAPSLLTIKSWTADFKRGRISIFVVDHPGRQNEVTTTKMIGKIYETVLNDQALTSHEIADTLDISTNTVQNILTTPLDMRKFFVRWVQRLLIIDNKGIYYVKFKRMFGDDKTKLEWVYKLI